METILSNNETVDVPDLKPPDFLKTSFLLFVGSGVLAQQPYSAEPETEASQGIQRLCWIFGQGTN
ncbi:hypothetical protein WMO24_14420 [Ruthenibacterium sp. CLA-JM-H11]|uniref:Uncharacterized protein n=1 Tax=Ruthenibacterium intestinale TaxID=3133163 RepID=A0ABV1GIX9_9FIRM